MEGLSNVENWCLREIEEAERAHRQYDVVEPENRLVARTLEQRWEEALSVELRLRADYDRFLADQPRSLTPDEQATIRRLAEDIPALWTAPTTTAADRQVIARLMLERVVIIVAATSEKVAVVCHWAGGVQTYHSLRRPVANLPAAKIEMHQEETWHNPAPRIIFGRSGGP